MNDLYASTNLIRACRAYDIGTGIIGKRLRETLCVIPIETDDTVEIGWIGLKGKTLITIEKKFLQILKKQIEEAMEFKQGCKQKAGSFQQLPVKFILRCFPSASSGTDETD